MATTAPAESGATRPHRWLAERHLLRAQLRPGLWALGLLLVVAPAVAVVLGAVQGLDVSVVQYARQGLTWFPFSIAVIVASAAVPTFVAAGLTRRVLVRASLTAAGLVGAAYALVLAALLLLERAVLGAVGWGSRITESNGLYTDAGQVALVLLDHGLLFVMAQLSGLLVGITYYRAGGWWGTLALPLTAGPILLVPLVLLAGPVGPVAEAPLAVRAAICAGLVALVAGAAGLLMSRTQLRP